MRIINYKNIDGNELEILLSRKNISIKNKLEIVSKIFEEVRVGGDEALKKISFELDNNNRTELRISDEELNNSALKIEEELKLAIDTAYTNIYNFHLLQNSKNYETEITEGITCGRKALPIENVGLYVPGGSAVLFSTMLMLAIPAKIAGCKRIVVSSPIKENEINPALAYCALKCGIKEFYSVGGAQAIAMFSLGTKDIKRVDKIFGPGNQYVTAAKVLLPLFGTNCTIDMPAGPSELLVIADNSANHKFVASDLLSQAEHGVDSQVILLTDNAQFAKTVVNETKIQLQKLPRKEIAEKCLIHSFSIITENLLQTVELSNYYAPEHLIINTKINDELFNKITNAGSIFLGEYACESAGDYASGTNHSLPTNGYAKSIGGVGVEMFMKNLTFQSISKKGLKNIGNTIIKLAEAEQLEAHANAVKIRMKDEY